VTRTQIIQTERDIKRCYALMLQAQAAYVRRVLQGVIFTNRMKWWTVQDLIAYTGFSEFAIRSEIPRLINVQISRGGKLHWRWYTREFLPG